VDGGLSSKANAAPVGIFDSGVGGLTVARAILDQLPNEPVFYVGDTARTPYGPRPLAEVRAFSLELMDHLVDEGVKALVLACNAASSACLRDARERYAVPVVEVIHPAVRRAVAATRNGKVGVIGTEVTIASRSYEDAFAAAPHLQLTTVACPAFVDFVERGDTVSEELRAIAADYLAPIVAADCDTVVLGCTHYPLLTGVISYVVGPNVTLVSSAEETAIDVYRVLASNNLLRDADAAPPAHRFHATGDPALFETLGRRFLGPEIGSVSAAPVGFATSARSS
jgi:glutamate racemase